MSTAAPSSASIGLHQLRSSHVRFATYLKRKVNEEVYPLQSDKLVISWANSIDGARSNIL